MRWVSAILLILLLILGMHRPRSPPLPLPTFRSCAAHSATSTGRDRRTGNLHPLERILFRRQRQPRQRNIRLFHSIAAVGPVDAAASDNPRPSDLADFHVLDRGSTVAAGGGAFLGYNTQWQDLVLGVEATYTHTNLNTTAPTSPIGFGTPSRVFSSLNSAVALGATGNLNLTDFATARGRAGYVIGNFLPYGFIGMAVGRASYSVSAESRYCAIHTRDRNSPG